MVQKAANLPLLLEGEDGEVKTGEDSHFRQGRALKES